MTPYYQEDGITIYHGDCREILPSLGRFDLLLTDPPYGIGDRWAKSALVGKNGSSRLWGKGDTWDDAPPDEATILQAIDSGESSILWGGNYFVLPPSRCWLVWDKVQKFTGADAELAWTNLDDPVRVFRLSRIDAYMNQASEIKTHPTQKPIALMLWCLSHVPDARTVLDPFMGSGTTLVACKRNHLTAVGIEREERYCEMAVERLRQKVLTFGLQHEEIK